MQCFARNCYFVSNHMTTCLCINEVKSQLHFIQDCFCFLNMFSNYKGSLSFRKLVKIILIFTILVFACCSVLFCFITFSLNPSLLSFALPNLLLESDGSPHQHWLPHLGCAEHIRPLTSP